MVNFMKLFTSAMFFLTILPCYAGGPINISDNKPVTYPNQGRNIVLNLDRGNLGPRSQAKITRQVKKAIALWNRVATSSVKSTIGSRLPTNVTKRNFRNYLGRYNDGLTPIIFDSDGSITDAMFGIGAKRSILGFAGSDYNARTGKYREGEALINGSISISNKRLLILLAHEFAHLFGLDHTQLDRTQGLSYRKFPLMYPIAFRRIFSLHPDDIAAVTELYFNPTTSKPLGKITGEFLSIAGLGILGANIWVKEVDTNFVYSKVSDYLMQNSGYFSFLLPPGRYTLHAESISNRFVGGSSVGPYAETSRSKSFKPPHPISPVTFKGTTASSVVVQVSNNCQVDIEFKLNGTGVIKNTDCNNTSTTPTENPFPSNSHD